MLGSIPAASGEERGRNTPLDVCPTHTWTYTRLWACVQRPYVHLTLNSILSCTVAVFAPCFLQFINLTLDPAGLKKWKTMCAKQIITNYMSAHIWAFPALISIILWCNRISWVSGTLSLNVTLGRRSDLPWRWHARCSCEEGIDRSSKAQSRKVTAG